MTDDTPLRRFERSLRPGFEAWHDGTPCDLDALRELSGDDRLAAERLLLAAEPRDARVVQGLAALGTPASLAALLASLDSDDADVRNAVLRHAGEAIPDTRRTEALVRAIAGAEPFRGLASTVALAAEFHPPAVVDALLRATLAREGDVAVSFAALVLFVHGKAKEPFDWEQRPFVLRFADDDHAARIAAFRELCARVGVSPEPFLAPPA